MGVATFNGPDSERRHALLHRADSLTAQTPSARLVKEK